ncbi:MAG TPA: Clp protease N-terminal domain-containing protein [Ktedonobacterales bacterium]|nr:Clp protease N-terminal domain-containing protein [Ktedonobacterales bacterium]
MTQLFRDTLRDEVARAGPPGALRAWGVALTDLASSVPREWPRELRRVRFRPGHRASHTALTERRVGYSFAGRLAGVRQETMQDKFEKFTERARKVMSLAQTEAQRFNHNYIGTEHILLGLVAEGDGVAAKVLDMLGVELEQVRNAVEFIIGRGDRVVLGEIGLTPRAKKVIELAIDEARRLNHHYIGTEHLLLGLIREGEGIAAGVLESLGVRLENVRRVTIEALNQGSPGVSQQSAAFQERSQARPRPDLGRFTGRARLIIGGAITEARERDQREVGTGHALLALLDEREDVAAWALRESGIDLDATRQALERELGPHPPSGDQPAKGPVDLDTHMLRVIALAADEASQMNHRFVGPEHLLLGVIREGEGLGGRVLLEQAADLNALRALSLRRPSEIGSLSERGPAVGQITLLCRDVTTTGAFYIRLFGATPATSRADAPLTLRLPGGGPLLGLRAAPADAALQTGAESITLDLWVGSVDLLWRTLKDANAANLSAVSDSPRGRTFTVADPDGRTLHVHALSDQQW